MDGWMYRSEGWKEGGNWKDIYTGYQQMGLFNTSFYTPLKSLCIEGVKDKVRCRSEGWKDGVI